MVIWDSCTKSFLDVLGISQKQKKIWIKPGTISFHVFKFIPVFKNIIKLLSTYATDFTPDRIPSHWKVYLNSQHSWCMTRSFMSNPKNISCMCCVPSFAKLLKCSKDLMHAQTLLVCNKKFSVKSKSFLLRVVSHCLKNFKSVPQILLSVLILCVPSKQKRNVNGLCKLCWPQH